LFLTLFFALISCFAFSQGREKKVSVQKPTSATMKAGAFIDVNTSTYPESSYGISQLIKDVLISGGSTCSSANVSNVVVSPNLSVK